MVLRKDPRHLLLGVHDVRLFHAARQKNRHCSGCKNAFGPKCSLRGSVLCRTVGPLDSGLCETSDLGIRFNPFEEGIGILQRVAQLKDQHGRLKDQHVVVSMNCMVKKTPRHMRQSRGHNLGDGGLEDFVPSRAPCIERKYFHILSIVETHDLGAQGYPRLITNYTGPFDLRI